MTLVVRFQCFVRIPIEQAVDGRSARTAVKLYEAHAALEEATRQDAVPCVGGFQRVAAVGAIESQRLAALF